MTAWTEDTSLGRKREPSVGEKRRPLASPLDCPVTVLLGSLPAHLCPRLPCPGLSPIQTAVSSWVHPFLCHLPSTADPESPSPQEDTREVILRFIVPLAPLPLQLHKTAQFPPGKGPWGLADSSPSSSCKERRPSDLAKVLQQVGVVLQTPAEERESQREEDTAQYKKQGHACLGDKRYDHMLTRNSLELEAFFSLFGKEKTR
ncbi:uncharacterized protein LOC125127316 isoform X3 [Phacochoerus africanus]|uniref:uncharacterized protein LOC125127316 isoform X3 n=1 Tax=Phacochoerus africanus TaxID=41426 RepID=UPI001FDA015D|nr:uncharacterized protein LOC125127316 isoform X3 [Phacochoerus africanus]